MDKRAAFNLTVNFLVIIIIAMVVFGFSVFIIKKFFTHAETIKMTYDERTEKEIERLLDDGSKVAIPFDKKTIPNGEFDTFGIGILNILDTGPSNNFRIDISFNKAFDKRNNEICSIIAGNTNDCSNPETWIQTTTGTFLPSPEDHILRTEKTIRNYEQEKFLLAIDVKNAPQGTYIFDVEVTYQDTALLWEPYDPLHKLYVDVP